MAGYTNKPPSQYNESLRILQGSTSTVPPRITLGCSKRMSSKAEDESKPEAYPQGYVEDFDEPRTKLADFFSILLALSLLLCLHTWSWAGEF